MTTDWDALLDSKQNVVAVKQFAYGNMSGRDLYARFSNTGLGGEVRSLLRNHGVTYSKRLARKALSRRGVTEV